MSTEKPPRGPADPKAATGANESGGGLGAPEAYATAEGLGHGEPAEAGRAGRSAFEALLGDVQLELTVELGRTSMTLRDLAGRLGPGSVIPLAKLTGEKLDVRINDRLVARGEAVAVGERYGVRVVELVNPKGASSTT